jgi:serine/threonine protein kinase
VASALQHAHSLGIVHGGLKLGSVFLHEQRRGEGLVTYTEVVKILDFEFACDLNASQPSGVAPISRDILVGVPAFMPPEALTGDRAGVDAQSDQWMVAVMAYRMLSGQLPFLHPDPVFTCALIREREPARIETIVPSISKAAAAAIHVGLAKKKAQRHATVLDLVRALEGLPPLGVRAAVVEEKTLHGFRPDLIALCRKGISQTDAVPVAVEEEIPTERYDSDSLVGRMLDPTQEDLIPYGASIPAARRKRRPWQVGVVVGLVMGALMCTAQQRPMRSVTVQPSVVTSPAQTGAHSMPPEGDAALAAPLESAKNGAYSAEPQDVQRVLPELQSPPGSPAPSAVQTKRAVEVHLAPRSTSALTALVRPAWLTKQPSANSPARVPPRSDSLIIDPLFADEKEPAPITHIEIMD